MKKIILLAMVMSVAACSTVKNTAGGIKKINDTCPPKEERTLKHIFCKEPK